MGTAVDDVGSDAFLALLSEGAKGPGPKAEALEALVLRPVWLATWEPQAEGFRTLINANGEEALAVFSSEKQLQTAAARFDWLANDGNLSMHRAIGGDILRHAWTREYAFVVVDVGSDHVLEYDRDELKQILRELDSTGPFRTSRPPPPAGKAVASSSFPPPVERISTVYSMSPRQAERLDRLSSLPTKPHESVHDSEPPTKPRAAVTETTEPRAKRQSSRPAHQPKSDPPGTPFEEVRETTPEPDDAGTYGAASIVPPSRRQPAVSSQAADGEDLLLEDSGHPAASSAPKLHSDVPTAPGAFGFSSAHPGKLKLPPIDPIGARPAEPQPPPPTPASKAAAQEPPARTPKPPAREPRDQGQGGPPTQTPPRTVAPSIGDGIKLVALQEAPDDTLLATLGKVMRGYFEIEWASYCEVARPAGRPSPAVALRITDSYRDHVTAIIKDLCDASRAEGTEIEVLLIDGHDMLRKARQSGFVFYPWKPKPFHG